MIIKSAIQKRKTSDFTELWGKKEKKRNTKSNSNDKEYDSLNYSADQKKV